ncbi:MAG: S8 family serine peptidase [Phycisphaerales bacterium]
MKRPSRFLTAFGGVVLVLAGLGVSAPIESASSREQTGKYYFKTFEQLDLDPSQIAVRGSDVAAIRQAAAKAGLGAVKEFTLAGWWMIEAPAGADIRDAVARLAAMPEVSFATPVFLGLPLGPEQVRLPLFPTPDVFVGFQEGATPAQRAAAVAGAGVLAKGELVDRDRGVMAGVDRIRAASKNGYEVLDAANAMAVRADVRFAEPDMVIGGMGAFVPNDPLFSGQWALNNANDVDMNLPEAWDITQGSASVIVMVIDVGVQMNHPDLTLWGGADFTGNGTAGNPGNACDRHGTPCAGNISARTNNGIGVAGTAGGCRVASARCFVSNLSCDGTWSANYSWTVDALNWAAANGMRVTSNSNGYGGTSAAMDTAYTNTRNGNAMVHFASNGNSGAASIGYPASSPSVNGVMAINSSGSRAGFSQYGPGTDYAGPGVGITSTDQTGSAGYINGDYVNVDGTSFACPNTAAVAALVISHNPALTAAQVESVLASTAKDRGTAGYDTVFGWGIPDAWRALRAALPRPANDDCSSAINVSSTGTFTGSLANATFAAADGAATCGAPSNSPDVWYSFTAPSFSAGQLRVTTCGTSDTGGIDAGIDTVVSILDGCGGTSLTCNDDWTSTTVLSCSRTDAGFARDSAVATDLAAGQTIKIRVSRYGGQAAGNFTLNVFFTPVNDACANAIDISSAGVSGSGTFFGGLFGATSEASVTACGSSATNPDIWWKFTAPAGCGPGRLRVTTCGTHDTGGLDAGVDTVLSIHTACGQPSIECNDDWSSSAVETCTGSDAGSQRDSVAATTLDPGQTVYIRVSRWGLSSNGARVTLNAFYGPANDSCVNAQLVTDGVHEACTSLATTDGPAEASCFLYTLQGTRDVWFRYNAACDGVLLINTCGSSFDTVLMVYPGTACPSSPGAAIACDDDGCRPTLQSSLRLSVSAGSSYLMRVGGYDSFSAGTIRLEISNPCPPACIGDFNQDGGVDGSDVVDFFGAWENGDAAADVNQDGGIDGTDIGTFYEAWESGC